MAHPTMFAGPRVKLGIKLTTDARALVLATQAGLRAAHGVAATESATIEYLVRKGFTVSQAEHVVTAQDGQTIVTTSEHGDA